jgi:hypothetical protein
MKTLEAIPEPEFSSNLDPVKEGPERRRAIVSGWLVLASGVLVTGLLYWFIVHLQGHGRSAAALAMPDMKMQNLRKFWSFPLLQASGLAGLAFAYVSVLLGLQQSARRMQMFPMTYRQVDRLHRQISLLVTGLVGVHIIATAFDAMGDGWKTILIPWQWENQQWPQAVWGYTLGIIAMWVLIIVAPTFYVRRLIRTDRWRFIHRFVLVFYVASLWHALILGVDMSHYPWIQPRNYSGLGERGSRTPGGQRTSPLMKRPTGSSRRITILSPAQSMTVPGSPCR